MSRSSHESRAVFGDWLEEQGYVVSGYEGYVVVPPCGAVKQRIWGRKEEAVSEVFRCEECIIFCQSLGAPGV